MAKVTDINEKRKIDFIQNYPDKFLACRDRHNWPQLHEKRYTRHRRLRDDRGAGHIGVVLITQRCKSCSRKRWKLTGNHGAYEVNIWHYQDPKGYAAPPGLGATKHDYMTELYRRLGFGELDLEPEDWPEDLPHRRSQAKG